MYLPTDPLLKYESGNSKQIIFKDGLTRTTYLYIFSLA